MARIGYNTPMIAFDHITSMLQGATNRDGIVSREDAKALVSQLRKEGRGSEAMAAQNMFKLIDARDNAEGARVTGYDLRASRTYVEQKMLQGYDVNRNGWSKAEIAHMSPTARALIELGRSLQIQAKPGRLAYATPEQGMKHIAALINQADGGDLITSRADRSALVDALYKEGRGTEALAVAYFFDFIDHRDCKPGARVTVKDINEAVEYSGTKLLRNKDGNHNGYSKAEYAAFSTTAKAFTLVGKMIDAGIIKPAYA